jgi:hypothetical protein
MYLVRMYECTSRILEKISQMFQKYSELYLAVPPPTLQAAPREDEPGILICTCVTCRKTLDLKK